MSIFAFVNNGVVDNIVEANEKRALEVLFPDVELLVEVSEETGAPFIGEPYSLEKNKFAKPRPWESFVWNESTWEWEAPIAYPNDGKRYFWDQISENWSEIDLTAVPVIEAPAE